MPEVNGTDPERVAQIVESIRERGWAGCPILVYGDRLLTGSHRKAALKTIVEGDDEELADEISEIDVAEDVTDLVEAAVARVTEQDGWCRDVEPDCIGWIFEGTWVEAYKDEIEEW